MIVFVVSYDKKEIDAVIEQLEEEKIEYSTFDEIIESDRRTYIRFEYSGKLL